MSLSEKQIIELITNDESADEYELSDFSDCSDSESNFTNSLRENLLSSISNNTVISENNRSFDIEILPIVCEDNVIIPPDSGKQTLSSSTIPQNKKGPDVFSEKWFYDDTAINSFEHKKFDFDDSNIGVKLDDLPSPLTEYDIFKTIFDEDLVQHIVDETNKFYHFVISNKEITINSKLNRWTDTNVDEMYSFFAVCLLMSHVKKKIKFKSIGQLLFCCLLQLLEVLCPKTDFFCCLDYYILMTIKIK